MATNYIILGESTNNSAKKFVTWPLTSPNKSYVGTGYYNSDNYTEYTATGFTSGCDVHFTVFGYVSKEQASAAEFSINYAAANGGSKNCLTNVTREKSTTVPGSGDNFFFSSSRYGRVFWNERYVFGSAYFFGSTGAPKIAEYFTSACNGTYTIKDTVHTNMPTFKLHINIK